MLVQPWPKLSETPRAIHLKELVKELKRLKVESKDTFFDQALSDNEEYRAETSNQIF